MAEPCFPDLRLRRLRRRPVLRDSVADVRLHGQDLICPVFVREGSDSEQPVASMPGVRQLSPDRAVAFVADLVGRGLRQVLLFGVISPQHKDAGGSRAFHVENPVHQTIRALRDAGHDVVIHADLCFCEYTDHGHCGALLPEGDPAVVDNDATLEMLGRQAVELAQAGADVVAPSGMMDGMVKAIRGALDAEGLTHVAIMSYAIKYASGFYGPFRDAGEGGMAFGDRRAYQMDYRRSREWRRELDLDLGEGADLVMVKPAVSYLDIIWRVRQACDAPLAAYHVSGEYAMLHAAAERGWLDLKEAALETTTAIRRAGADLVVTYFAPQLLEWLEQAGS